MLESPLIIFGFFLIAGLTITLLGHRQQSWLMPTAFGLTLLGLLFWFLSGGELAQVVTFENKLATIFIPNLHWELVGASWTIAGVILLLVAGVQLFHLRANIHPREPGIGLLLAGSGLATVSAANIATLMLCWTLLAVVWTVALVNPALVNVPLANNEAINNRRPLWVMKSALFLLPLLFLGVAASTMPLADLSEGFADVGRSPIASAAMLLAALGLMGLIPLQQWRPHAWSLSSFLTPLTHLLPTLAGAGLMARLADQGYFDSGVALTMTLFCLLSVLFGIRHAWSNFDAPSRSVAGLAMSVAGIAYLCGLWGDGNAFAAMMRVHGLALGVLFLFGGVVVERNRLWRLAAPLVALVSLAGLPLTAGFAGLAPLYEAWLGNGRYLLVFVTMVLLIPLLTAVFLLIRKQLDLKSTATESALEPLLPDLALIMFIPGLLLIGDLPWSALSAFTWLAILIPLFAGLLLPRLLGDPQETMLHVSAAFTPSFSIAPYTERVFAIGRGLVMALSDAARILEGEHGLAWLLLFLLIFVTAVAI